MKEFTRPLSFHALSRELRGGAKHIFFEDFRKFSLQLFTVFSASKRRTELKNWQPTDLELADDSIYNFLGQRHHKTLKKTNVFEFSTELASAASSVGSCRAAAGFGLPDLAPELPDWASAYI